MGDQNAFCIPNAFCGLVTCRSHAMHAGFDKPRRNSCESTDKWMTFPLFFSARRRCRRYSSPYAPLVYVKLLNRRRTFDGCRETVNWVNHHHSGGNDTDSATAAGFTLPACFFISLSLSPFPVFSLLWKVSSGCVRASNFCSWLEVLDWPCDAVLQLSHAGDWNTR